MKELLRWGMIIISRIAYQFDPKGSVLHAVHARARLIVESSADPFVQLTKFLEKETNEGNVREKFGSPICSPPFGLFWLSQLSACMFTSV
jgi:hypothetical protein